MKYVVRAALAVAMLVGFYVLAVCLVLALVLAVLEVLELGAGGLLGAKAVLLVVPAVCAIGYGVFFRTKEGEPHGIVLSETAQPRLWALAQELATVARTAEVDEIRLVPEANAAVSDSSTWLGLRRGTRRMFIGVPLLLALDEPQMRAVVAHEFGHYGGRHTTLVRITYRGAESIRRILSQLGRRNPVAWVLRLYGSCYFAVSRSVNRRQELEADQLGAQVTSPEVMASALLELEPAARAWAWYGQVFSDMGTQIGRRPQGGLAGFAEFLEDPEVVTKLDEIRANPADLAPSVYDTHPSTGRRVSALGVRPPVVRAHEGWALELIEDPDDTFAALERELYDAALVPTPLEELASLTADDAAARHARLVDDVLISQGRPPGLRTVMQYLGNGMSRELVRRELPPGLDEEQVSHVTAEILGGYLAAALVEAGRARHRLDWLRGWAEVDLSGHDLELGELVTEVMAAPARVSELDELLRLNGVSSEFRAADHEPAGPRVADAESARILGVISPVNRSWTLVVHEDGLVLLPEQVWRAMVQQRRPFAVSALVDVPKARAVLWKDVEQLRRVELSGNQARILCEVTGQEPLEVRIGARSREGGHPYSALRDHLGARYRAEERVGTRL